MNHAPRREMDLQQTHAKRVQAKRDLLREAALTYSDGPRVLASENLADLYRAAREMVAAERDEDE